MTWDLLHPAMTVEALGLIPLFLSEDDPRPAWEQIHAHYHHGGGWSSSRQYFKFNPKTYSLASIYPDDPPMQLGARAQLRSETILFYRNAWVVIMQKDGSYDVARID